MRWLERLQLGTSYPAVTERVAGIVGELERKFPDAQLALVVDQTGVGLPVVEIVREALKGSRCSVTGAVLTGTERMEGSVGRREIRVGKTHLVSTLQALLEQRLIALPETAEGTAVGAGAAGLRDPGEREREPSERGVPHRRTRRPGGGAGVELLGRPAPAAGGCFLPLGLGVAESVKSPI